VHLVLFGSIDMDWDELLQNKTYLAGEILVIHHLIVHPELQIEGSEKDFDWVKRQDLAFVAIGPVHKFAHNPTEQTFAVKWKSLHMLNLDFSLGERLKNCNECGISDIVTVSTKYRTPTESTKGVLYLGTGEEITDVYLLPAEYEFASVRRIIA